MAILIAIMLLFGFTPIGYIPLPFAELTLMCLPVIIGTLVLGLNTGMGLSVVFILTSIYQLFTSGQPTTVIMREYSLVYCLICITIPRLLIPLATHFAAKALRADTRRAGVFAASAAGSLANTFIYLSLMQLLFVPAFSAELTVGAEAVTAMIWGVVLTNGIPEAVIAIVVCPAVVLALRKTIAPIAGRAKNIEPEKTDL
jgi:uncharacterized membrane protein